jgi:hypothetical protein
MTAPSRTSDIATIIPRNSKGSSPHEVAYPTISVLQPMSASDSRHERNAYVHGGKLSKEGSRKR